MPQPFPEPLLYDSGGLACGALLLNLPLLFALLDEGHAVLLRSNDLAMSGAPCAVIAMGARSATRVARPLGYANNPQKDQIIDG